MYPFLRFAYQMAVARRQPTLQADETAITHHICWPWDIDPWMELNNGRTLTLYDMGRLPHALRIGMLAVMRKNGWGMTVAGSAVRYRRRIRMFERFEMRSRALGWDDKFLYLEQSMWKTNGECAGHAVFRMALTGQSGIVPPAQVVGELDLDPASPDLPAWVVTWLQAEAQRPWPPMQD